MRVSSPWPLRLALFSFSALWPILAGDGFAKASDKPPKPPTIVNTEQQPLPGPLVLDEAPEPLPPEQSRTEAEQDRVDALALFSAGRMLEWQEEHARALRRYQRALRYDPQANTVARALVGLAIRLHREDEAVRLVLNTEDPEAFGPTQLQKLLAHLINKGDWQRAVAVYEKLLAVRAGAEQTPVDFVLRLAMGRLYYLTEQYEKAADCFGRVRDALQKPDEFGLGAADGKQLLAKAGVNYGFMGMAFLRAGRIDEAAAAFQQSHQLDADDGLLGYHMAEAKMHTGHPAEALEQLQTYFDKHLSSEGVAPYQLFSRILEALGNQDELVARLEKLYADDPANVPLGYFLAECHHQNKHFDQAESLYRSLSAKSPTMTGYRALLAIARETGRPEALLELLGEAAAKGIPIDLLNAQEPPITDDGQLVRTLIETARRWHQEAPDRLNADLLKTVALLAMDGKDADAAREFFELAIQAGSKETSELLLIWGLGLLSQEQYAEAARVFQRGIDENVLPDANPIFHYYLSLVLELDGRTDQALAAAQEAADRGSDKPRFLSRVAWILYHADRREEAAKAYAELIDKFDSDFGSAEVRQVVRDARLALSNLAVLAGNVPQAQEWLEQVLDEFPDDIAALNDLGYLWADETVRVQRAHRMIRRALDADPENAAYRDSLGWVLYRLGRLEEAVVELEKAAEGDQPDPIILDHLGDAYHAARQPEKAQEAWQRAVKAFQQTGDTDKANSVQEKITKNRQSNPSSAG